MATNSQYSVVTADCLVSIGANPYDALVVKTAAVWYKDARLALGFSGLAGLNLQRGQRGPVSDPGSFRTMWWLLDGILGTSKPDYMMQNSLARLAQYMATTFPPAGTPPSLMALELGFAGSWSTNLGIKQVVGKITNLDRTVSTGISRDFTVKLAIRDDPALWACGLKDAIDFDSYKRLFQLVEEGRPARAITNKGIDIIRNAARSKQGNGRIGEVCTSIVIPAGDPSTSGPITGDFKVVSPSDRLHQSHLVDATDGPDRGLYADAALRGDQPDGTPGGRVFVFPVLPSAAPCACGSGLKFRHCHTRRKASRRRRAGRDVSIAGRYRFPVANAKQDIEEV